MSTQNSKKTAHTGKIIVIVLVLFAAAAAGFGYFSQTSNLRAAESSQAAVPTDTPEQAEVAPLDANDPLFTPKAGELVFGDPKAPATIIEYSSMSCPHCAFFHSDVLPELKKDLLDSGKAKLVFRYFPLNEPALRATQLVECAPAEKRAQFVKVLFELQKNWAFSENFKDELKTIAAQGGVDAAQFDSCLADTELENSILESRKEAATRAGVNSTPSFFVNGKKLENFMDVESFTKAAAAPAEQPAAESAPKEAPAEATQPAEKAE